MRDLKTLYELLLSEFTKNGEFICNTINKLYITKQIDLKEKRLLLNHFRTQYPTKKLHSEFYHDEIFNKQNKKGTWFGYIYYPIKGREIRIEFLNKIISTL